MDKIKRWKFMMARYWNQGKETMPKCTGEISKRGIMDKAVRCEKGLRVR